MSRAPHGSFQSSLFAEETVDLRFVAKLLGKSDTSIKRYLESGKLKGYQLCDGGQWHILRSSLDELQAEIRRKHGLDPSPIRESPRDSRPPILQTLQPERKKQ